MGVGGACVVATEIGQAVVFGKSRIVPGSGAIGISQRQFYNKFQMIHRHKDFIILKSSPRTKYANREYLFTNDNMDQLLNCKLINTSKMAMAARAAKFYRLPTEVPMQAMEIRGYAITSYVTWSTYVIHCADRDLKKAYAKRILRTRTLHRALISCFQL